MRDAAAPRSDRTRRAIVEAALDRYVERGFSGTTMAHIAQAAGIGTSTLYRHFPQKELTLVEPMVGFGRLSRSIEAHLEHESAAVAVGRAVADYLDEVLALGNRAATLQSVLAQTPTAQARLWDRWVEERRRIAHSLGDDDGRSPYRGRVTGEIAIMVATLAFERAVADGVRQKPRFYADQVLEVLAARPEVIPVIPLVPAPPPRPPAVSR